MIANGIMRSAAYWLVKTAAWLFINVMAAIGVLVTLFWLMANANAPQFFAEIGNLAAHFEAAPLEARSAFCRIVSVVLAGASLAVSACRLSSLFSHAGQPAPVRESNEDAWNVG